VGFPELATPAAGATLGCIDRIPRGKDSLVAKFTMFVGVVLILLGLVSWFATAHVSVTALIPAFFGLPLVVLGWLSLRDNLRKAAMHVAVLLGLLGFVGSVRGVAGVLTLAQGGTVERPAAAVAQTIMAVLCLAFLILAVKSFVDARRQRAA